MGMAVQQWILPSSVRYGLTSKVELRWGLPAHMVQHGGGTAPLTGISDQSLSALYRFREQGKWLPALALNYGIKIPISESEPRDSEAAMQITNWWHSQSLYWSSSSRLQSGRNNGRQSGGARRRCSSTAWLSLCPFPEVSPGCWIVMAAQRPGTTDRYGAALTGGTWALTAVAGA